MAQNTSAVIYAKGEVRLNGEGVVRSSPVLDGDRIDTCADSAVTITSDGSAVAVAPGAVIRFSKYSIVVFRGTVHVDTSDGMWGHAAGVTVMPKDKAAKFDVTRADHKVLVTSREGALTIHNSGRTSPIESGATTSLDDSAQEQAPQPRCKKKMPSAPKAVVGTTTAGKPQCDSCSQALASPAAAQ
jgi:hypothetical protein